MKTLAVVLMVIAVVALIIKIIMKIMGISINVDFNVQKYEDFDENRNNWGIIGIHVDNSSEGFRKYYDYLQSRIKKYGLLDAENVSDAPIDCDPKLMKPGFKSVIYDTENDIYIIPGEMAIELAKGDESTSALLHHLHIIHPEAQFVIGDTPAELLSATTAETEENIEQVS